MKHTFDSETEPERIFKLQHELVRILTDIVDPMSGLATALGLLGDLPGIEGVWTWFRNEGSGNYHLREAAGLDEAMLVALDFVAAERPLATRLSGGAEIDEQPELLWPAQATRFASCAWERVTIVPIRCGAEVVGAVGAARRDAAGPGDHCLWLLRSLAAAVGSLVVHLRHETRQRAASENLNRILDAIPDRLYVVGPEGRIIHHNAAAGADRGPADRPLAGQPIDAVLRDGEHVFPASTGDGPAPAPTVRRCRLRNPAGVEQAVEAVVTPIIWDGRPAEVYICRGVADPLGLAREGACLDTAINQLSESVVITDPDGRIEYVNPAFSRLTGYAVDEVLDENPRLLKSGVHDDAYYRDMWKVLTRGEEWSGQIVNRRKDGSLFTEQVSISPVRDASGVIAHYVAVKRDVTHEAALEVRLREKQKMEALGTLAGGIAHDFNNILYALLGYADLALDDIAEDHPAHHALGEIAAAGRRASRLVAKVLSFGRRGDGSRQALDLAELVRDSLELVRAGLPSTIRIRTELAPVTGRVMADGDQLQQVLLNLATNAQYAMRDRDGVLTVAVDEIELDADAARREGELDQGAWVRLRVADTGRGIDPAIIGRIFEPYFTTRTTYEGTGLGLATVHGIVKSHGGHVQVTSAAGAGSEFTVYLPVHRTGARDDHGPADRPVTGRGRLMVIDDEPMVAEVVSRSLERFGFEVRSFGDGVEAVETFRHDPDSFDLVITDQTMPNITGFELAARMLAIRPDLPVVLATGHGEAHGADGAREAGIRRIVSKPLRMRELCETIDELIREPAGTR